METICVRGETRWVIPIYLFNSNFQLFYLSDFLPSQPRSGAICIMFFSPASDAELWRWIIKDGGKWLLAFFAPDVIIFWDVPEAALWRAENSENTRKTFFPKLTSHISRKSCCSTRSSSHVVFVTTVLSRGKSCNTDSPNVAPTPRLHSVIGLCGSKKKSN